MALPVVFPRPPRRLRLDLDIPSGGGGRRPPSLAESLSEEFIISFFAGALASVSAPRRVPVIGDTTALVTTSARLAAAAGVRLGDTMTGKVDIAAEACMHARMTA